MTKANSYEHEDRQHSRGEDPPLAPDRGSVGRREIIIARGNEPVVRLVLVESARPQRTLGWAKGQIRIAEDFDEPLDDFAEYR